MSEQRPSDGDDDELSNEQLEALQWLIAEVDARQMLREGRYDITEFATAINDYAAHAEATGDLEGLDRLGDFVITSQVIFPEQTYVLTEVLAISEFPAVRGTAAFALSSAIQQDEQGTIAIWKKLLADSDPWVSEAAVMNYRFAVSNDSPRRLRRRHRKALRRYVEAAETRHDKE